MRYAAVIMIWAGAAFGQTMTEFGAAAAVGSVGGANGQNVGKGLTAVFGKINAQTAKAAGKEETSEPALKLGPGQSQDTSGVPLPPPSSGRGAGTAHDALPVIAGIAIPAQATQMQTLADVAPSLPPPPEMSLENLKTVSAGMSRADLLKLGAPASKISMDEDGHMLEVYSYRLKDQRIGTVRLNNGAVTSVE